MSFSAALRRASPLAIRAIKGSLRSHSSAVLCSLPRSSVLRREPRGLMVRFSSLESEPCSLMDRYYSLETKSAIDDDLLRAFDSEIKLAEECDDHDWVPKDFPFQIVDKEHNCITLERNYYGEVIEVVVSIPSLVKGEEPDRDSDDSDGNADEIWSEILNKYSLPLSVTISKGQGPCLKFNCTAYSEELIIKSMTLGKKKESDADEEIIDYEGPDFMDLDKSLQKVFYEYLETRGISPLITDSLCAYMINKDKREYLIWLKKFRAFIEKT